MNNEYTQNSEYRGQKINKNMLIQNQKLNSRTYMHLQGEPSTIGGEPSPSYAMALEHSQKSMHSNAGTDNMHRNISNLKIS